MDKIEAVVTDVKYIKKDNVLVVRTIGWEMNPIDFVIDSTTRIVGTRTPLKELADKIKSSEIKILNTITRKNTNNVKILTVEEELLW